jgi:ketosteroid isomerase-like protein
MRSLADRYNAAFVAGDVDAMRACYSPDAEIVQIVSDRTLTVEQSVKIVPWLHRKLPDLWVEDRRTTVTTDGFVLEYLIRGTNAAGQVVRSPTCLVVEAGPTGITRIVEYFDQVAAGAFG